MGPYQCTPTGLQISILRDLRTAGTHKRLLCMIVGTRAWQATLLHSIGAVTPLPVSTTCTLSLLTPGYQTKLMGCTTRLGSALAHLQSRRLSLQPLSMQRDAWQQAAPKACKSWQASMPMPVICAKLSSRRSPYTAPNTAAGVTQVYGVLSLALIPSYCRNC